MYVVQFDVFRDSQDIFLIDSITNFIGHLLHPWHHVNFRKQNKEHCSCPWGHSHLETEHTNRWLLYKMTSRYLQSTRGTTKRKKPPQPGRLGKATHQS